MWCRYKIIFMLKTNTYWIFFATVSVGLAASASQEQHDFPGNVTYDGAQVWRTALRSEEDIEVFTKLVSSHDISLWRLNSSHADYLIQDNQRTKVNRELQARNLNHTVLIMNVQHRIAATAAEVTEWTDDSLRIGHRLSWNAYPTLKVIEEYYDYLKENFPSICKIETIGKSVEKRPIKMIVISNGDPKNKPIVINSGSHAREWVGITSALYIANNIITKYDQQPTYITTKDWYIIPVLNPDGYVYTHTTDRLWRKSRRENAQNKFCAGVDINRNFAKNWKVPEARPSGVCEEDYGGTHAFSEPESQAMKKFIESLQDDMPTAFIDLHSYGQLILYPWGVKKEPVSSKIKLLKSTADGMKTAMYKAGFRTYKHGTTIDVMYTATGSAIDWIHDKGVPLSYAIETRDTGTHGFLLPPYEIESTGKEILTAIRHIAKAVSPNFVMRDGQEHRWF